MTGHFCVLETVPAQTLVQHGIDVYGWLSSIGVTDSSYSRVLDSGDGMGSGPILSGISVPDQVHNCRLVCDEDIWLGVLHGTDCQATQSYLNTLAPEQPTFVDIYCARLESGGMFDVVQSGELLLPDGTVFFHPELTGRRLVR